MWSNKYPLALLAVVLAFFVWSAIEPHDTRLTWVLETLPFMIALPVLLFTCRRFPLTNLTYTLIAVHAMILMLGAHYSYAKVPLGFWMEDWFGWTRNNYDKIGHFMQGFAPAIYVREILARTSPLRGGQVAFLHFHLRVSRFFGSVRNHRMVGFPFQSDRYGGLPWDTRVHMGYAKRHVLVPRRFDPCAHSSDEIAQQDSVKISLKGTWA